jgi:hypothetical protein
MYCIFSVITYGVMIANVRRSGAAVARMGLWYAVMVLGSFFGLLMVPFSLHHARQISENKTTVEFLNGSKDQPIRVSVQLVDDAGKPEGRGRECLNLLPGEYPFDLGFSRNWQQVMGEMKLDRWVVLRIINWILPLRQRYAFP